ncbi:hypothetical protein GCM10009530_47170 [Microbispora corallina]|uniref:Uncharacterized protein n=1 Tax=Microbispora corallina TaxID=83302 RepID=A0ABQ4G5H4_9ACTN|nr:hypothetical protein Mco01_52920 [Microbispora corallina]
MTCPERRDLDGLAVTVSYTVRVCRGVGLVEVLGEVLADGVEDAVPTATVATAGSVDTPVVEILQS